MHIEDSMDTQLMQAQIDKYKAEAAAFRSEEAYNNLQSARLKAARRNEKASLDNQRILDFITEVSDASVHRAVTKLGDWRVRSLKPITVRFNSPGGDLISGMALYDYIVMLRQEGIEVTTVATGMCASMAAVLLQAGTKRLVTPNAWFMIHEVSSFSEGKLSEIEDETKWLIRAQSRFLDILAERSKLSKAEIKRRWRPANGWWMTPEETIEMGFADEIATGA